MSEWLLVSVILVQSAMLLWTAYSLWRSGRYIETMASQLNHATDMMNLAAEILAAKETEIEELRRVLAHG